MSERHTQAKLGGVQEAKALLRNAGLGFPPIPEELAPRFERRDDWCFCSRAVRYSPYDIDGYVKEATTGTVRDYVLLAHAGHGINSRAIHYYLIRRPLQLFLQIGWGGVYMDKLETTANVNRGFIIARELVQAVDKAVQRGRLRSHDRLTVVASDFYGGYCVLPGGKKHDKNNTEISRDRSKDRPYQLVSKALRWCNVE